MKLLQAYKFPILIISLILIYSSIVVGQSLIKSENTAKVETKTSTPVTTNQSVLAEISEGNASAQVNVENKTPVSQVQPNNPTSGTCKVTRNGVVTIVPADQVKIDEKSSGDVTVKVECDNSSSSSSGNSSSKTTIKNDIDVKVNTSN